MSVQGIGLSFFLKRPKNRDDAYRYVYLRITMYGSTTEYSTRRKWEVGRWDRSKNRARGRKEDAISLNNILDTISVRCHEIRSRMIDSGIAVSAQAIKQTLLGRGEEQITLMTIFATFLKNMKHRALAMICTLTTVKKYEVASLHMRDFLRAKYDKTDILLKSLNYEFIEGYDLWLRVEKKCCNNTALKYLSNIKTVIYYAIRKGFLRSDPFEGYKIRKSEVLIVPLSPRELRSIALRKFTVDRLQFVRDVFLFCCYTGLSYSDVRMLKSASIQDGFDNELWLTIKRRKTGVIIRLPLLEEAKSILHQYERDEFCLRTDSLLPIFSNQKTNEYLKEIAALSGISRRLTFHMARHTFATTITLANGVPIETVSKMLGHSSLRQTQHYAKVLDRQISQDMKQLKLKLSQESKN
ncbi:site-specific integrase [Pedobacter nyackensis]|uniref:site-specific integrase n=1 Tax=Pedobacter nyackensis TaxID=475255 RepID=UPI00292E0F19|nr:site-specific integrase [Pedobacter nyackensis]